MYKRYDWIKECFFFRKVDEINAEEEIREAFKVFDSVIRNSMVCFIIEVYFGFRMAMVLLTDKSLGMSWKIWGRKWRKRKLNV